MKTNELWVPLLNLLERNSVISLPQAARLLGTSQEDVFNALEELVFSYDVCGDQLILERNYASLSYGGDDRAMKLSSAEEAALEDCLRCESEEAARILHEVTAACDSPERRVLRIEYQGEKDAAARLRDVEPLALRHENGHLYLRAWCLDAQSERDFRLDRIKSADSASESSVQELPDRHEAAVAAADDDTLVTIELAEERLIEELPQARISKHLEDGRCKAKLPWHSDSPWLPKHIAASGGALRPIAPDSLREATRDYIESLLS